jgi:hypothetical protein
VTRPRRCPRRRVPFWRSYAATWVIPVAVLAVIGFAFWPLLAFRHHWVTYGTAWCWQNLGAPQCADVQYGDVTATFTQAVTHSGPTVLGAWLTAGWIGFWFVLVMAGAVHGRRQPRG